MTKPSPPNMPGVHSMLHTACSCPLLAVHRLLHASFPFSGPCCPLLAASVSCTLRVAGCMPLAVPLRAAFCVVDCMSYAASCFLLPASRMYAVCRMLFAVSCVLLAVCCLLLVGCCLPPAACAKSSPVHGRSFVLWSLRLFAPPRETGRVAVVALVSVAHTLPKLIQNLDETFSKGDQNFASIYAIPFDCLAFVVVCHCPRWPLIHVF